MCKNMNLRTLVRNQIEIRELFDSSSRTSILAAIYSQLDEDLVCSVSNQLDDTGMAPVYIDLDTVLVQQIKGYELK